MLLDIFRGEGTFGEKLATALLLVIIALISLTVHEVAHGYAAYKCGDHTARNFGRLSLNPLKHLDPLGALMMLIVGFGWAKPVPINTRNFKNPRRDTALTALAGPLSNIILAFISCPLMMLVQNAKFRMYTSENISVYLFNLLDLLSFFLIYFHWINISFAVFNMIPVPPFDGSRIFYIFLPPKYYFGVMKYERYIYLGMMVLMLTGVISMIISPITGAISSAFQWLWGLLPVFG